MNYCMKCGTKVEENSRFCSNCGFKLIEEFNTEKFNYNVNNNGEKDNRVCSDHGYNSYIDDRIRKFTDLYDLKSVDGILSIPATDAKKYSDNGECVVCAPEQILNRKATEYKNSNQYDLAIACLKKVNEMYPYSFYEYTRMNYERLVDMMILAGRYDEAKDEHEKLDLKYGTYLDHLHELQDFVSEMGTESKSDYQKRIIDPYIEEAHDRECYYWLLENIPDIAPKSYGGYRRMKKMQSSKYKEIVKMIEEKGYRIDQLKFWK